MSKFDDDPEALAWARERVQREIERLEKLQGDLIVEVGVLHSRLVTMTAGREFYLNRYAEVHAEVKRLRETLPMS